MRKVFSNEPLLDFSNEAVTQHLKQAFIDVKKSFGQEYPLVIGGQKIFTEDKTVSVNPSRFEEVCGYVSKAKQTHIDQAFEAAATAFDSWKRFSAQARANVLYRAASAMRKRRYELVAWVAYESGRNWGDADYDVAFTIDHLEYYGRIIDHIQDNRYLLPLGENEDNRMSYIPLGVGVVISPWNFPLALMTGMVAAAIVAGNTVLVKPASTTPILGAIMNEIWEEAGLPTGVLNFVPGDGREIGDYLVSHPQTRFVAFTGSKEVGLRINQLAATHTPGQLWIKRVMLEMGGKDAILVDNDADLESAADGIVSAAFGFQGQKCAACSRAILHADIYDKMVELLLARTKKHQLGETRGNYSQGPVIDKSAYSKIREYIEIGKQEGTLLCGGGIGPDYGYYIEPTIFGDIAPGARLAQEEIFGPVLSLIKCQSFEEGIEIFNNTEFGLTGAYYGRNRSHLETAREELYCGNLNLNANCTHSLVGANPFGGFNMSGTDSKTGSPEYLTLFTQAKTVTECF